MRRFRGFIDLSVAPEDTTFTRGDAMPIVDVTEQPTLIASALLAALPQHTASTPAPRIAIVCMTKRPTALSTWLSYHRLVCGIDRFYLRVEDTPELAVLLGSAPWDACVEAEYSSGVRDYFLQVDRQNQHINSVLPRARAAGFAYLLHIDDDELLYCAGNMSGLHAALSNAPASTSNLHVHNLEALLPHAECVNPFTEVVAFRHDTADFCAYANGKSFGRLSDATLRAAGPHNFGSAPSRTHQLPPAAAVILHFESANATVWRAKYLDLACQHAGSDAVRQQAPSAFYSDSMRALSAVVGAQAAGDAGALRSAEEDASALYARWKLARMPLPPPPADGTPRFLAKEGVTLINVLAQPRIAPPWPPPMPHILAPAAELARAKAEGAPVLQRLEELLRDANLVEWAAHANALHAAADRVSYLDNVLLSGAKSVGFSVGARMRLRGAVLHACRERDRGELTQPNHEMK